MPRLLKTQIIGGGGMGTGLADKIGEQGHFVLVQEQNPRVYTSWSNTGCNDLYSYLAGRKLPKSVVFAEPLKKGARYRTAGFDYTIIAVPASQLQSVLERLYISKSGGPIVLLQKGVYCNGQAFRAPHELVLKQHRTSWPRRFNKGDWDPPIMTFTGSAFAKNILDGGPCGMILATSTVNMAHAKRFAGEILDPCGVFWTYLTSELRPVALFNALRTVSSCIAGALAGYMQDNDIESVEAFALQGIERERIMIARNLLGNATFEVFDPLSRVRSVLDADLLMCKSISSRNYDFGYRLGQGASASDALEATGQMGVVECLPNIDAFARIAIARSANWSERYPYLSGICRIINSQATVEEVAKQIMARRPRLA